MPHHNHPPKAADRLLTKKDVSRLLQVSIRTISRLHAAGRMPRGIKLGRTFRFRESKIQEWIDSGCPSANNASSDDNDLLT